MQAMLHHVSHGAYLSLCAFVFASRRKCHAPPGGPGSRDPSDCRHFSTLARRMLNRVNSHRDEACGVAVLMRSSWSGCGRRS